jgi:hypothetical protein
MSQFIEYLCCAKHCANLESIGISMVKHARLLKNYVISGKVSDIGTGTEQV